jgi:hypothetical protein
MTLMLPLLVLQARAEARAILYSACEFDDLDDAIAPLLAYAADNGIAEPIAADIIRTAFAGVAEPCGQLPEAIER